MTTTIQADSTPAAEGRLGIGTPKLPRDVLRYLAAEAALVALENRIGEPLTLVHREDAPLARRWWLGFPDGSPVALCSDPLEAVEAGEQLL